MTLKLLGQALVRHARYQARVFVHSTHPHRDLEIDIVIRCADDARHSVIQTGALQHLLVAGIAGNQWHIKVVQAVMRIFVNIAVNRHHFETHLPELAHDPHAGMPDANDDDMPPKS